MKSAYLICIGLLPVVLRGYCVAMVMRYGLDQPWWLAVVGVVVAESAGLLTSLVVLVLAVKTLSWAWWKVLLLAWPELWAFGLAWPVAGRERALMMLVLPSWMAGLAMAQDEKEKTL